MVIRIYGVGDRISGGSSNRGRRIWYGKPRALLLLVTTALLGVGKKPHIHANA